MNNIIFRIAFPAFIVLDAILMVATR